MPATAPIPPSAMTDLSLLAEWERIDAQAEDAGRTAALVTELERRRLVFSRKAPPPPSPPPLPPPPAPPPIERQETRPPEPAAIESAAIVGPPSSVALGIRAALAPIRQCDQHRVARL